MQPRWKIPQSVLVVIHTAQLQVLLLRRTQGTGETGEGARTDFWQSVTGSKDALDEPFEVTARREVLEETGIDASAPACSLLDWNLENTYSIYPQWLHRYEPGVRENTERIFSLRVPDGTAVALNPREHTAYEWWDWREAADRCYSPSNTEAILWLPRFVGR
ncbi:dihydroneopterin triphosphate diphosphatase [Diaphorobacter aerolatus]|uniref:Dihydroneopterin triphosphate diphosphatase n=2 Tax=Diaphorobacter aerolatus TaxID=1288495 RepID=A0A7H0GQN6_9BURK|nr:dihydroneopterin triphosphate diphosphatase [Diaphorobacter aerolatus]QNP50602.1 dihydroneopterin triphosphate diphosphatase [Diaphorobacter aerolatus]